jgi:2-polyprenyl-3-methyl-5-hydroxy-6-metoxy-1,4-benzoquinol methylase
MSRSPAPLNSHWDGRPHEYDELRECWLNQRRLAFLVDQIRAANLPSDATVLEVGSGTGWLLRRLAARFPDHRFVGLEPDAAYVDFARRNAQPNEQHSVGVAEELEAGSLPPIHMLLSNDVLHHVHSMEATFRSAAAIASPRCVWWAIEPNFLNPYTFLRQHFTFGERNFLPRSAMSLAASSGWRLTTRRNLFLVPPFVRQPASWMRAVEARFEDNPILGGGLCLRLVRR